MKALQLSLFLLLAFTFACQSPVNNDATLEINVAQLDGEYLTIRSIQNGVLDTIFPNSEPQTLSYAINKDDIFSIVEGRTVNYAHMTPGSTTKLTRSLSDSLLIIQSSSAETDSAFKTYAELYSKARNRYAPMDIGGLEPGNFLDSLKMKYAGLESLTQSLKTNADVPSFIAESLKQRTNALMASDAISYPNIYNYINKEKIDLTDNLQSLIDQVQLGPSLLAFQQSRDFLVSHNNQKVKYENSGSVDAYFNSLYESGASYESSLVAQYVQSKVLTDQLNFGSGIDGVGAMKDDFTSKPINDYFKTTIDAAFAPWMSLKKGMPAPNVQGTNSTGEVVNLTDLKGKAVYVDVWATWCGPCIAEIPSIKKLEKSMHDDPIEFVSISIDEMKDKEKWKQFIIDEELGGVQIMAKDAWKSDVTQDYNIKGIPRFLLIDKEGLIVSSNAPRPSDEKLRGQLDAIL